MAEILTRLRELGRKHWNERPRWLVPVVAVLGLVLVVSVYAFSTRSPDVGAPPAELSGGDNQTTSPFEIGDGWRIDWSHTGETFAIAVSGDRDLGTVVDRFAPGSGSTDPMEGGVFHLRITAEGPWSIRIVQPEDASRG